MSFLSFPRILVFLITEKQIRDRFVRCLNEVHKTESKADIARALDCSAYYLSYLPKAPSPKIPSAFIANFCLKYRYSVTYILTGKGDTKQEERRLSKEEKWQAERDNLHEIIAMLIKAGANQNTLEKLKKQFISSKS